MSCLNHIVRHAMIAVVKFSQRNALIVLCQDKEQQRTDHNFERSVFCSVVLNEIIFLPICKVNSLRTSLSDLVLVYCYTMPLTFSQRLLGLFAC